MDNYLRHCLNEDHEFNETKEVSVRFYTDGGYYFITIEKDHELWDTLHNLRDGLLEIETEAETEG